MFRYFEDFGRQLSSEGLLNDLNGSAVAWGLEYGVLFLRTSIFVAWRGSVQILDLTNVVTSYFL